MKQLPGLTKPERESMALICLILYKSYLLKKNNNIDFRDELFQYIK